MKQNTVFYTCHICHNVIGLISGDSERLTCCGKQMEKLIANTFDASKEKHMPVCERIEDEIVVKVGIEEHPMSKDHYVMWIAEVTDNKTMRVRLYPEQATETRFKYIPGATIYAYCNKHGLWSTDIE